VLGLTAGITSSILLFLYVWDEFSYDKMFSKWEQIYRVNTYASISDIEIEVAVTMFPLGPVLKK